MKSREFEREVKDAGGVLVKTDGDHRVYELPNRRRIVVPVGGKHSEACPYLRSKLKRLLREPAHTHDAAAE